MLVALFFINFFACGAVNVKLYLERILAANFACGAIFLFLICNSYLPWYPLLNSMVSHTRRKFLHVNLYGNFQGPLSVLYR